MTTDVPRWIAEMTDTELSEAIESTGAMANRLYCEGCDTAKVDARLDELMAEADRRMAR